MASRRSSPPETFESALSRIREGDADEIVSCIAGLRAWKASWPRIANYLAVHFAEEPKLTRVLLRAAGRIRYRPLLDVLADRLRSGRADEYTADLIDALGRSRQADYAAVILAYLDHESADVRTTAVHALGLLGSSLSITPLLRVMTSSKGRFRELALDSLRRLLERQKHEPEAMLGPAMGTYSHPIRNEIRDQLIRPSERAAERGETKPPWYRTPKNPGLPRVESRES